MLYSMLYNDYAKKGNNSCFIDYEHRKSLIACYLCMGSFHVAMKRFVLCCFFI